jgi:hypothetical protein
MKFILTLFVYPYQDQTKISKSLNIKNLFLRKPVHKHNLLFFQQRQSFKA